MPRTPRMGAPAAAAMVTVIQTLRPPCARTARALLANVLIIIRDTVCRLSDTG